MSKSIPAKKRRLMKRAEGDSAASKAKILDEIQLTSYKKLIFSISEWKGTQRLDIREMIDANYDLEDQKWVFTKKGINMGEDLWGPFFKTVKAVRKTLIGT